MEGGDFDAFLQLAFVVLETLAGLGEEDQDGGHVGKYHEGHEEVCQVPHQRQVGNGAPENHAGDAYAEEVQRPFLLRQVADIDFPIVIVADKRCEGEEENQDGYGFWRYRSEVLRQVPLDQLDAGETGGCIVSGQKHNEGRRGANEERIHIDAEGLDESLHCRMAGIRGSCCIRHRALAGFIREEAALEAREDSRPHAAAKDSLEIKGIPENDSESPRHFCDIEKHDAQGDHNVKPGHDGHHPLGDASDAAHAAADDCHGENRHHAAYHHAVSTKSGRKCQGDGIRLYRVVNHTVGHGNQNRKERCPQAVAQAIFQIVRRTAAEAAAVFTGHLVNLGQRTFYEARSRADDGDEPHPENRAGAPGCDGDGDARNISHAYTRRGADAKGLEWGNLISRRLRPRRMSDELEHFSKVTDLHRPGAHSEIKSGAHQ